MKTLFRHARDASAEGFTLIELLVVVLIIGILAAIALPNFLGSRTKAKNAATMTAVRNALTAAKSYYTQGETYSGLTAATLNANEGSISSTELVGAAGQVALPAPASGNNPQQIWVGGSDGTNAGNAGVVGTDPTSTTMVLCGSGKGDTVFCAADNGSNTLYSKAVPAAGSQVVPCLPSTAANGSAVSFTGAIVTGLYAYNAVAGASGTPDCKAASLGAGGVTVLANSVWTSSW